MDGFQARLIGLSIFIFFLFDLKDYLNKIAVFSKKDINLIYKYFFKSTFFFSYIILLLFIIILVLCKIIYLKYFYFVLILICYISQNNFTKKHTYITKRNNSKLNKKI
jgi:hypothetical protein